MNYRCAECGTLAQRHNEAFGYCPVHNAVMRVVATTEISAQLAADAVPPDAGMPAAGVPQSPDRSASGEAQSGASASERSGGSGAGGVLRFYEYAVDGAEFIAVWHHDAVEEIHARCEQWTGGAQVCFFGPCIHLQSIVHEVHHAVDWLSALGKLNGREEQARYCGMWVEEIVGVLLRDGWRYGCKSGPGVIFNTDVDVALLRAGGGGAELGENKSKRGTKSGARSHTSLLNKPGSDK